MDAELYARLSASAGIAALCGQAIYAMAAPEEARGQFIVWQRISGVPEQDAMDAENDIIAARVQIDSYATSYGGARAVADAVRATLKDWRGTGAKIAHVRLENDRAIRETDPALKTFRVSQDYIVTFTE
jgi:hypothetical protein